MGGGTGRVWGWNLPGGGYHTNGDAKDPVTRCRKAR